MTPGTPLLSTPVHGFVVTLWSPRLYRLLPREHIRYLGHQRKHKVQDFAHFINTRPTISIVVLNLHVIFEHFAGDFQIMYYGHELKMSVLGPLQWQRVIERQSKNMLT